MPKFTFLKKVPYLGELAAAVRGGVAGREERVAGRARAARLAVSPAAVVERVVSARLGGGHVPASNVVVAAVRGDFSSCRNRGHYVKQNKTKKQAAATPDAYATPLKSSSVTRTWFVFARHTRAQVDVPAGCQILALAFVAHPRASPQPPPPPPIGRLHMLERKAYV